MSPNTVPTAQPEVRVRRASFASWSVARAVRTTATPSSSSTSTPVTSSLRPQHPLVAQKPQRQPARVVPQRHIAVTISRPLSQIVSARSSTTGDGHGGAGLVGARHRAGQAGGVGVGRDQRRHGGNLCPPRAGCQRPAAAVSPPRAARGGEGRRGATGMADDGHGGGARRGAGGRGRRVPARGARRAALRPRGGPLRPPVRRRRHPRPGCRWRR